MDLVVHGETDAAVTSEAPLAPEQVQRPRLPTIRKGHKAPYRALSIPERDFLFALYDKYNGNLSHMVLDPIAQFKAYSQVHYYIHYYNFRERYAELRRKKTQDVIDKLQDAKMMALERAMEMLRPYCSFVYTKTGVQVYDGDGKPMIIEKQPFYKEVKAAWEIIKTELGEPTSAATDKGTGITNVVVNIVSFNNNGGHPTA